MEVLSLSVDSVFVHKMWNDNELARMVDGGVPFPMLSDAGGRIGAVYGVYDEEAGVEMRGRFLIDPDGVIQAYEVVTAPVGRQVDETLRQLQAFQYVRASNGTEQHPRDGNRGNRRSNRVPNWSATSGRSGSPQASLDEGS